MSLPSSASARLRVALTLSSKSAYAWALSNICGGEERRDRHERRRTSKCRRPSASNRGIEARKCSLDRDPRFEPLQESRSSAGQPKWTGRTGDTALPGRSLLVARGEGCTLPVALCRSRRCSCAPVGECKNGQARLVTCSGGRLCQHTIDGQGVCAADAECHRRSLAGQGSRRALSAAGRRHLPPARVRFRRAGLSARRVGLLRLREVDGSDIGARTVALGRRRTRVDLLS